MPLRQAIAQVRQLAANSRNTAAAAQLRDDVGRVVEAHEIRVRVVTPVAAGEPIELVRTSEQVRSEIGRGALRLYFAQLNALPSTLLDLRLDAFAFDPASEPNLAWHPGALFVHWDHDFIAGLRTLYAGFYGDDAARLERGLRMLGLRGVREPLLAHLGGADPTAMTFSMTAFHESFHSVFEACRDTGVRLHPNFLPLGVLLAGLYETLEKLNLAFDVSAAYRDAV